ncbi:MAG: SDR family oxidoreductase [Dehalococcoidia bacterium]
MATQGQRRHALITGASAGIGEAFAKHLAKDGYDLVLVARRRDRLDKLAHELSLEHGIDTEVIEADLATDEGVSAVEERIRRGDIELLVNNAGFGTFGSFAQLPLARELEELDVNVRALMRLSHAALGPMMEHKSGGIINVASAAAFQPIPHNATYSATKAFVLHFSEALHEEARAHGVTVTALCPGPVRTEFQQVSGLDESQIPSFAWESVDSVVDTALSALRGHRAIAIPGAINMMTSASVRFVPRFMVRRIAGAMFRDRSPK